MLGQGWHERSGKVEMRRWSRGLQDMDRAPKASMTAMFLVWLVSGKTKTRSGSKAGEA